MKKFQIIIISKIYLNNCLFKINLPTIIFSMIGKSLPINNAVSNKIKIDTVSYKTVNSVFMFLKIQLRSTKKL